jgi:hypothetical protein
MTRPVDIIHDAVTRLAEVAVIEGFKSRISWSDETAEVAASFEAPGLAGFGIYADIGKVTTFLLRTGQDARWPAAALILSKIVDHVDPYGRDLVRAVVEANGCTPGATFYFYLNDVTFDSGHESLEAAERLEAIMLEAGFPIEDAKRLIAPLVAGPEAP